VLPRHRCSILSITRCAQAAGDLRRKAASQPDPSNGTQTAPGAPERFALARCAAATVRLHCANTVLAHTVIRFLHVGAVHRERTVNQGIGKGQEDPPEQAIER
jgi:hypothetical protein